MPRSETSDRPTLTAVFYPTPSGSPSPELGQFTRVDAHDMPAGYRGLLAHDGHMTVTMELCHLSKVDVEVLDRRMADDGKHYSRKSCSALRRPKVPRRDGSCSSASRG